MKVFITGGAGFIGSHLCQKLLNLGFEVVAYDNLHLGKEEFLKDCKKSSRFQFIKADLLDYEKLKFSIKGSQLVYHLAANSDIQSGGLKTDTDLKLGTLATYNVLEAMREHQIKELIFASTSAIYGEADIKPTPENYGPLIPISLYGASKLAGESLATAFAHNFSMKVWIYRFANIVGSNSTHGAIHDFILRLKKDSSSLRVLGNGTQKKSYLHVDDCISAMIYGYEHSKNEVQIYNLASEGVTQVKFLAEEVIRQMDLNCPIIYDANDRGWKGDVPYTWLDSKKINKMGWKAKLNSDEAVKQAIQDILSSI